MDDNKSEIAIAVSLIGLIGGLVGLVIGLGYTALIVYAPHGSSNISFTNGFITIIIIMISFIVAAILYMLPTILLMDTKYIRLMLFINLLLGLTVIAWILCLLFAVKKRKQIVKG